MLYIQCRASASTKLLRSEHKLLLTQESKKAQQQQQDVRQK